MSNPIIFYRAGHIRVVDGDDLTKKSHIANLTLNQYRLWGTNTENKQEGLELDIYARTLLEVRIIEAFLVGAISAT